MQRAEKARELYASSVELASRIQAKLPLPKEIESNINAIRTFATTASVDDVSAILQSSLDQATVTGSQLVSTWKMTAENWVDIQSKIMLNELSSYTTTLLKEGDI
jgi:hypothetical protein